MKEPIFKREELKLCYVPVPDGYPQSQTHAGVACYQGRTYLTTSPYPGPKYGRWEGRFRHLARLISFGKYCSTPDGEYYENPCLYIGEEKGETAAHFKLMQKTALMDTPADYYGWPCYNSDPDIFIENGTLYILNRSVIRTEVFKDHRPYKFVTRVYLIKGVDENGHFKLLSNSLVRENNDNYVSPSLVKYKGDYIVAHLENRLVGREVQFDNLYLSKADEICKAIEGKEDRPVTVISDGLLPWHMSLFTYHDKLYSIITCVEKGDRSLRMWQMIGKFDDELTNLKIYSRPLCDYNSYRGEAVVHDDGVFVLYSPTVHEKITGGSSVDGREIMVVSKNFEELLSELER